MPEQSTTQVYEDASRVLRQKREQLTAQFLHEKIPNFMELNTRLLDDYFCKSFETSMVGPRMGINKNPYVMIALGGYGRQEQCVQSDVDILFLFKREIPEKAEALIREIIFPLWDIGLDIGHATRTLKDCTSLAVKDFEVLTSLLDARFICGMSPLYSELMVQLREKVIFRRANKIVDWLVQANQERHRYFGDSAYLLEPNLKEGQGGLRDYHTMLWLGQVKCNLKRSRDLEYQGHMSHDEYRAFSAALQFIWNVRSGLHILTGRKYDQLHFEYQSKIAEMFHYTGDRNEAVEQFLGELHGHQELIKQHHQMFLYEMGKTRKWYQIKKKTPIQSGVKGLTVKKDMLTFTSSEHILENPELLIRIYEESAALEIPLQTEARRLIREFSYLVDDSFRAAPSIVKSFERILVLRAPDAFNVLNEMLNTGFLVSMIPELAGVVNRIEFDTYHVYPVDRHLLRTVRTVKRFGTPKDPTRTPLCSQIYDDIEKKHLLLLAALLHDAGKGVPGQDHTEAGEKVACRVLTRMGYDAEEIELVTFLVREHLFLFENATRRDIEDGETIAFCLRRIRTTERLKMMYLLSVADLAATGPKAWSDWTATLLRELFLKVLRKIEKQEPERENRVHLTRRKLNEILEDEDIPLSREELETLLNMMSPRYLLYTPVRDIRAHIRLYIRLETREEPFAWEITPSAESDTRTVTVCEKNLPGAFSKIAGVFALNRINILNAQVHTWRNHTALSIIEVDPPPDPLFEEERWTRAERELRSALKGKLDLRHAVSEHMAEYGPAEGFGRRSPHRINIDNETSSFATIIEVFTRDFPGLLFKLTDALFRCHLDICSAQIATTVDQVVDVFYVKNFDGLKVEEADQVERIRATLASVLPEITEPENGYSDTEQKVARQKA